VTHQTRSPSNPVRLKPLSRGWKRRARVVSRSSPGCIVRLRTPVHEMDAGDIGTVIGRYTNTGDIVVAFGPGKTRRVAPALLAVVQERAGSQGREIDDD